MRGRRFLSSALVLLVASVCATTAGAQQTNKMPRQLEGVTVEERLGSVIPLDLVFTNEDGEEVSLDTYFDGDRPVLLALVYHECPMLCNLVLHGLTETLRQMQWTPGDQFEVVSVSFNPRETPAVAADAKQTYLSLLDRPEAEDGWHFLTGSEASIGPLTEAVGFRYHWVEEEQQYAHPSTLIFLSGDGKVSRYLHGIEYRPSDVRNALVEASEGKVGSAIDQVILFCFQYDPNSNSYVPHALNLMKLGGMLTVLLLGSLLFVYWRREARRLGQHASSPSSGLHVPVDGS